MRLYSAVCAWLEAHAAQVGHDEPGEPQPQGDVYSQVEHAHSYTSEPELHAGHRGTSLDDDDGGAYKNRRIGFTRN